MEYWSIGKKDQLKVCIPSITPLLHYSITPWKIYVKPDVTHPLH
jgi:hypothetical protein